VGVASARADAHCPAFCVAGRGDGVYWAVPVSFNRTCEALVGAGGTDDADDDFVVFEFHSANPVQVEVVQRGVDWYRRVLVSQTMAEADAASDDAASTRTGLAASLYTMSESAGVRVALVNPSPTRSLSTSIEMRELR
jgi:hypothetical protein